VGLDAVILTPISSAILRWLRFIVVGDMIFSLAQKWFGIV
jgi:hypothetical protein